MDRTVGPPAQFSFTKLVVHDLDRMATFYEQVYGLVYLGAVHAEISGRAVEEVLLGASDVPSLILLKWTDEDQPRPAGVILGFTTSDITSLFAQALLAGGRAYQEPRSEEAAGGLRVGFLEDPEGHLTEIIEMPGAGADE